MAAAPPPWYVLRGSQATVNALAFASCTGKRTASAAGQDVGSEKTRIEVVVAGLANGDLQLWDLHRRRPGLTVHGAHSSLGLFGLQTVPQQPDAVLSHGRDAVSNLWRLSGASSAEGMQLQPLLTVPDVGSLSFCRLAVELLDQERTLIAVAGTSPNLVQLHQLHWSPAAIATGQAPATPATAEAQSSSPAWLAGLCPLQRQTLPDQFGVSTEAGGMIMSIALAAPHKVPAGDGSQQKTECRAVVGYEDGSVGVWSVSFGSSAPPSDSKAAMIKSRQFHKEPVTALACNRKGSRCVSGAAEDCLYIIPLKAEGADLAAGLKIELGQRGVNDIRLRPDERLFAVGCWNGHLRLFSWPQGRPLATLDAHRDAVMSCCFSWPLLVRGAKDADFESPENSGGDAPLATWSAGGTLLAAGSKDGRISLWDVYTS